jgi:hypothetical protein
MQRLAGRRFARRRCYTAWVPAPRGLITPPPALQVMRAALERSDVIVVAYNDPFIDPEVRCG